MTNDFNRKIDEILHIVQSEQKLNDTRYSQLTTRTDALAAGLSEVRSDLGGVKTDLNEVKTGLSEVRFEVGQLRTDLKQDIDKVYTTLVEDLQAFASNLEKVERRVVKIERKAS